MNFMYPDSIERGPRFDWTDERLRRLKELWAANMSAADIAAELGTSRNAVLGKAHRLRRAGEGISGRSKKPLHVVRKTEQAQSRIGDGGLVTKVRMRMQRNRQLQVTVRRQVVGTDALNQILKASPIPPPATDDLTRTAHSVALLGLTNDTCRWPCGEPSSADFFYCGRPEADLDAGRPYCWRHTSKARVA